MKIAKNRIAAITIAICLMISMGGSTMLIPSISGHTPAWALSTFAHVQACPNPVGVGETVFVYMFLGNAPFQGAQLANNYRYHNYQLTITAPDGKVSTQTWAIETDPTGNQVYSYTPTDVGTYTFNFTYPGETITAAEQAAGSLFVGDIYLPSSSSCTLTVQQEPIPNLPDSYPLPTAYWTRPIYSENTYWYTISSDWLGTGSPGYSSDFPPGNAVGPQTSHVMWTYPLQAGGVVGGNNFAIQGNTYFEGSAYLGRFQTPIIMDGYLYYTKPVGWGTSTGTGGPTVCQDLRTGKILWSRDDVPVLSFGYIYDTEQPNEHGVFPPILFTANFARAFDAYTGDQLFNVTGVPTGTAVLGPSGEVLRYVVANAGNTTNPDWRLGEWNSSKLWFPAGAIGPAITNMSGTTVAIGTPIGDALSDTLILDGSVSNPSLSTCRYDWNISLPWLNVMGNQTLTGLANGTIAEGYSATGSNPDASNPSAILAAFYDNMLLCRNASFPSNIAVSTPYTYFAVDINTTHSTFGQILWMQTQQPPPDNLTVSYTGPASSNPTAGVFVEFHKEAMQFVGYSLTTGQKLWGPVGDQSQNQLMYYNSGYNSGGNENGAAVAYGNIYYDGFGGVMSCYNLTTGNLEWTYGNGGKGNSTNSGFQVPGLYPTSIFAIGNGIIYTTTTEHTVETPPYKGAMVRAINATTGQEVWTLNALTSESGPPETGAIADGFATFFNGYANQVYSVGRGLSATTIQASLTQITVGNKVVIQGTVTDISAGTQQTQQAADFPNGVPCASDASMSDWMGYVYQQKPEPTNFTGVLVSIDAIDPNGNFIHIGTATSDANGLYHYTWAPPNIPGDYVVTATFAGTNGYWGSNAETAMTIQQAPSATATPTATSTSMADTYFVPAIAGLFVLIIVVAIVLVLLMLRKRP